MSVPLGFRWGWRGSGTRDGLRAGAPFWAEGGRRRGRAPTKVGDGEEDCGGSQNSCWGMIGLIIFLSESCPVIEPDQALVKILRQNFTQVTSNVL